MKDDDFKADALTQPNGVDWYLGDEIIVWAYTSPDEPFAVAFEGTVKVLTAVAAASLRDAIAEVINSYEIKSIDNPPNDGEDNDA